MSRATEDHDTIAAISTPQGEGGIGVVRLSGDRAEAMVTDMYRRPSGRRRDRFTPRTVTFGYIVDATGARIDEVLVTVMKAPATYTREDVVEISCHGGSAPTGKILEQALARGARLARPGEFSKRAFLNGRIDLIQAEAIIDLIRSRSDKGWKTAFSQLDGRLSDAVADLERRLVASLADIEASIDFPDEELDIVDNTRLLERLRHLEQSARSMVATYGAGKIYRDGVGVAIVGRPNVGKSSLMNRLLDADRVIVTATPGTTRDTVEETLHIEGIAVRIVDTAGVRETDDEAERFGVERTLAAIDDADIVMPLFDQSVPLTDEDRHVVATVARRERTLIVALNKSDLPTGLTSDDVAALEALGHATVRISAKEGEGVDRLRSLLAETIRGKGEGLGDGPVLTRERHMRLLADVADAAGRGANAIVEGLSREFVAAELGQAKEALEELTGKVVDDQVIDRIFEEFCIGK